MNGGRGTVDTSILPLSCQGSVSVDISQGQTLHSLQPVKLNTSQNSVVTLLAYVNCCPNMKKYVTTDIVKKQQQEEKREVN